MATKINFLANEFKKILSNHNLGELVNAEPIADGAVQTNFFLKTKRGSLFLNIMTAQRNRFYLRLNYLTI